MIPFNPRHEGLYHTQAAVDAAHAGSTWPPLAAAWAQAGHTADSPYSLIVWNASMARFKDDRDAADIALGMLGRTLDPAAAPGFEPLLACAHALELLRGAGAPVTPALLDAFAACAQGATAPAEAWLTAPGRYADALMATALNMAASIVLEDEAAFTAAVGVVDGAVRTTVRPQGFIAPAVEGKDGGSMNRSVRASAALVLMAEMAAHAGADLWGLEVRGVSVLTAAIHPMYYVYTTQKWKWDSDISPEAVQALYRTYGGYLEMVYRRFPTRDVKTVLEALRPVFTPLAGGCATLSHAQPERPRRGLFGR